MKNIINIVLLLLINLMFVHNLQSQNNFELVKYKTKDDGVIEAAMFKGSSNKIVIFAHGAIFNKESWYFLATKLQSKHISSLVLDFRGYGSSKAGSSNNKSLDILGAISYLSKKGYDDINIIGASMGGAAVLNALPNNTIKLNKIVLMAPAGGPPVNLDKTEKLFIVSKNENMYKNVKSLFENSSEPKTIIELKGNTHAQHLFKTKYADKIETAIVDFISKS